MINIGIVVPVLNQFEKAVDALASIRTSHRFEVKVIPNYRQNQPLAAAWNEGLEWSLNRRHSFTLIINDDILFAPQSIDNMVKSFLDLEKRSRCAMITGNDIKALLPHPEDILTYETDVVAFQGNPDFACFMVRPTIAYRIGFFDENFIPAYFEDNDYHHRINLGGLNAYNAVSAPYYHYGSQTQNADINAAVVPPFAFEMNRSYYIEKWGGEPGKEQFIFPYNDSNYKYTDWRVTDIDPLRLWAPPIAK